MTFRLLCDFDGTIALRDVTDALLAAFAAPGWREIEMRWQAGEIGSGGCMAGQVALLRTDRAALDALLDAVAIDPAFPAFVAFCRRMALPLTIVSDGLDYAIDRILARHGIVDVPVVANHLHFLPDRQFAMTSPHAATECETGAGTCKCHVARLRGASDPVVLIGDGLSDVCAASTVDMVFAKHRLLDLCRARGIAHQPFLGFDDIPRPCSA